MQHTSLKANLLLLLTAAIWGLSFVAQRAGMEFLGPFTFNGVRFLMGTLSLLPVVYWLGSRRLPDQPPSVLWLGGLWAGLALFAGSSLQQIGIQYTTAGKAGFITGLYVVLVPFMGLILGRLITWKVWAGAFLATIGLYFLSVAETMALNKGDTLVAFSALFFAFHVLLIDHYVQRTDALKLSMLQFSVCTIISLIVAFWVEQPSWQSINMAWTPLLYAGIMSVGVAYTLQVIAQQDAHPAHAAIILSLEGVFAVLGGWWLLNEVLTSRQVLGCSLMLAAMLVAQWRSANRSTAQANA